MAEWGRRMENQGRPQSSLAGKPYNATTLGRQILTVLETDRWTQNIISLPESFRASGKKEQNVKRLLEPKLGSQ